MTTGVSPARAWRVTISLAFRAWPLGAVGRVAVAVVSQACRGVLPGLALRRVIQGGGAGWMAVLACAALVPTATSPLWEYFQRGLISRNVEEARLERVQNVNIKQGILERILQVGTVDFDTASNRADDTFQFRGIAQPERITRLVDQAHAANEERQRQQGTAPAM